MVTVIYSWECDKCQTITEVERKVADIDKKPDGGCSKCAAEDMKRVILPKKTKGFVLNGDGWHHTEYSRYRSIK